jgi:hypothetical protein
MLFCLFVFIFIVLYLYLYLLYYLIHWIMIFWENTQWTHWCCHLYSSCISAMQRYVIVLACIGSQYSIFHSVGWDDVQIFYFHIFEVFHLAGNYGPVFVQCGRYNTLAAGCGKLCRFNLGFECVRLIRVLVGLPVFMERSSYEPLINGTWTTTFFINSGILHARDAC